ncbi:SRPBCC family protein [Lysobacter sp. N42]|uniref:SRPBCC family protein n=1 Tax=Lysobacter sp. N42 TaxID=2545719 RepID=UPI0010500FC0|nr:SRPBCC family protein [Lysobacter sp. N42]TCZ86975.1 polyketide cyclase [Lysobacter sp. N42]
MTRLLEILISFAIVAVLFVAVGIFLPSSRHLSHSVETNRKPTIVFDTLNSFRRFKDWNPLVLRDPSTKLTFSGPQSGKGATMTYESESMGSGTYKIIESEPTTKVTYAIENDAPGTNKRTEFRLKRVGRGGRNVQITQTYSVDYGWNIVGRYAGLYVSSNVGEDVKLGLSRLTNMLAGVPNIDYGNLQREFKAPAPSLADRPAETLLVVSATVPMDFDKIKGQMNSNMEWIRKVMTANGLEAAGPVRMITNEQGSQNYSFDLAQPVRKAGATGPVEGIRVEGPVKVLQSEATKVATTSFKGHMANLQKLRDAIRAWALSNGYETVDRPYENWTGGINAGFTNDGEFVIQWAVK